jgi:chondroitin AC lyase
MNSLFYGLLVLFCLTMNVAYGQDDLQIVESRITRYLKEDVNVDALNRDVQSNLAAMQLDGHWSTVDYASKAETNWSPLTHLNRMKQFALALALNGEKQTSGQKLVSQTRSGLRYWLKADPKSINWFQNDIASPTAIGEILMLLKDSKVLPSSLQDSLIHQMKQGNVVKVVGANKLDIAIHMMYRACLTKDKPLMDSAINQAFLPVSLARRQGLQYDYSYLQHGPQLQIASYGQVFLIGEYKVASWLLGTNYALAPEKLRILDHYLIHTYLKTIRGRYIDFNTEGRGISRNDILDKMNITTRDGKHSLLGFAKEVNPGNASILDAAEQRILQKQDASYQVKPAHTYFYKADYTIHNRPAYSFNVRAVSKRTFRTESGNQENLIGKFLPDGATNIQRSGTEYVNIMPIWEWDKIPGITSRDYAADQKNTIDWGERGVGEFTGGTSDGLYGTTVYQLNYNEVTAKKAWFFFDDEVVCLGTDINSLAKESITTTVNQAWLKGPVKVFEDGMKRIWHDSTAYYFPNQGSIKLSTAQQKGSWYLINANRSKSTVAGKVFKLWFDHGKDPVQQSYAYVVRPGISEDQLQVHPNPDAKILMNTAALQAVENEALQMLQVVFYEPGTLTGKDYSISADQPCVILVKDIRTKNPILYLSDPAQKLTDVHLTFSSKLLGDMEPVSISLPQGDHKGATQTFQFNSL